MKLTYDREADALYIGLRRVMAAESLEIEDGVIVDVDDDGHIIDLAKDGKDVHPHALGIIAMRARAAGLE